MRKGRVKPTRTGWQKLPAATLIAGAHLPPLTLLVTGTDAQDWIAFAVLYPVAIFAMGGSLHRYFAHRAFKTSRVFQFALGLLAGTICGDPVAFAGKHRLHHKHSDTPLDVHSPGQGWWFCWIGSLLDEGYTEDEVLRMVPDLTRYPELMWLHRAFYLPALLVAAATFAVGGYTMFATGFCLNLLVAIHAPSAVNYFCHKGGLRRYETPDDSTNRPLLGFLLLGEGWHHNHHYYPAAARSGFFWYELDIIYYMLNLLSWLGVVWDVRDIPASVKYSGRLADPATDAIGCR